MSENPRRGMQARNVTTNVPKILDLKSSSEQIFFRKLSLGAPDKRILRFILDDFESTYNSLLDEVNCVFLYNTRIHNCLILLYKSCFWLGTLSTWRICSIYVFRLIIYVATMFWHCLCLKLLLMSFILFLVMPLNRLWNLLPDSTRTSNFTNFKKQLASLDSK